MLFASDEGLIDAPERFFAVEVDGGNKFDAVFECVVGEADGLGTVSEVLELVCVDIPGGVHLLGDGDEAAVDVAEGFSTDVDLGELDVHTFFIRDTHVVGEGSGADAC